MEGREGKNSRGRTKKNWKQKKNQLPKKCEFKSDYFFEKKKKTSRLPTSSF